MAFLLRITKTLGLVISYQAFKQCFTFAIFSILFSTLVGKAGGLDVVMIFFLAVVPGRPLFFMIPEDQSHSHLSKVGIEQARCTIPMPHGEWLQNALGILQASTLEASKRCAREKGVTI